MVEIYQIKENDNLLRRVPKRPPYINDGKISSAAFKPSKRDKGENNGLSVDIENLTTYQKSIINENEYNLYKISAEIPLKMGLECKHDPIINNDAHALIIGNINDKNARLLKNSALEITQI